MVRIVLPRNAALLQAAGAMQRASPGRPACPLVSLAWRTPSTKKSSLGAASHWGLAPRLAPSPPRTAKFQGAAPDRACSATKRMNIGQVAGPTASQARLTQRIQKKSHGVARSWGGGRRPAQSWERIVSSRSAVRRSARSVTRRMCSTPHAKLSATRVFLTWTACGLAGSWGHALQHAHGLERTALGLEPAASGVSTATG
mmetsp:Transcript_96039/g.266799  ORF Transcript_96039/g.266799 Transcript_96039/m.266799 type:complete len:200 (+) Transcript_96039:308-907(+)